MATKKKSTGRDANYRAPTRDDLVAVKNETQRSWDGPPNLAMQPDPVHRAFRMFRDAGAGLKPALTLQGKSSGY